MKNLLIVDDEKSFLLSLLDMLKGNQGQFFIVTANNGKEAVEVLSTTPIDLVVTDLKMPEMDGFELLAYIGSEMPDIPVIVMSAFGTPEIEERLQEMGSYQYIEKPIDFDNLLQVIIDGLNLDSPASHITGFSIASFLQLLEHEKKTCSLTINSSNKQGCLYFREGTLFNAQTHDIDGLKAALEIISWEKPEIKIENSCTASERLIQEPLGFIIIESSRMIDEKRSKPQALENSADKLQEPEVIGKMDEAELEELEEQLGGVEIADIPPTDELETDKISSLSELPDVEYLNISEESPTSKDLVGNPENALNDTVVDRIMAQQEIDKVMIISRDGTVLAQRNFEKNTFGTFLAFVEVAAEQLRSTIGFTGPEYIIMSRESGHKLIITPTPHYIIGLEIDKFVAPKFIIKHLKTIIDSIDNI